MAARTDAGIEPEVHGDVLGLGQQVAGRVEHRRRAVGALLDVRARRRPAQHRAHLVGDAAEPRHQHLQPRGVEASSPPSAARGRRRAPGSAAQPSGSQIVQSGSAIATGPVGGRPRRRRAGRTGRSSARERCGGADGDDLDGRVGPGEAVALLVGLVERGRRRHGELVALAGVAAVDRGGRDRVPARPASPPRRPAGAGRRPARCGRAAWATSARGRAASGDVSRPDRRQHAGPRRARSPRPCRGRRPARRRAAVRRRRRPPAPATAGSTPRSTDTARSARSIDASTTRITPSAVTPAARERPRRRRRGRAPGRRRPRRPGCGRPPGRRR